MVAVGFDNPEFSQFVCYSILLILETIGIALLIIRIRVKRKVHAICMHTVYSFEKLLRSIPSDLCTCTHYIMIYFNLPTHSLRKILVFRCDEIL